MIIHLMHPNIRLMIQVKISTHDLIRSDFLICSFNITFTLSASKNTTRIYLANISHQNSRKKMCSTSRAETKWTVKETRNKNENSHCVYATRYRFHLIEPTTITVELVGMNIVSE